MNGVSALVSVRKPDNPGQSKVVYMTDSLLAAKMIFQPCYGIIHIGIDNNMEYKHEFPFQCSRTLEMKFCLIRSLCIAIESAFHPK